MMALKASPRSSLSWGSRGGRGWVVSPPLPLCQLPPLRPRLLQLGQAQGEAGSGQPRGRVQHVGGQGALRPLRASNLQRGSSEGWGAPQKHCPTPPSTTTRALHPQE